MRTLILSIMLLASPSSHANPAPTLQSLLDKHAQAMGPVSKVQSRRLRMRLIGLAPFALPLVVEASRPALMRKDVTIQGSVQVTAYDGKQSWMTDPFVPGGMKPAPLPALEAKALADEADFDGILVGSTAKGVKLAYAGPATVDGKPAHALGVTRADGSAATIWLDAGSFLEVKRTQPGLVMGAMKSIDIFSSDYRLVDGVRIAHRMEIGLTGAKDRMSIVVDAAELNVRIDPARFARPQVK
ncbi:hypothetical protein [Massilia glaciei]|nr:hypothetical protein [Massilia glaciei]